MNKKTIKKVILLSLSLCSVSCNNPNEKEDIIKIKSDVSESESSITEKNYDQLGPQVEIKETKAKLIYKEEDDIFYQKLKINLDNLHNLGYSINKDAVSFTDQLNFKYQREIGNFKVLTLNNSHHSFFLGNTFTPYFLGDYLFYGDFISEDHYLIPKNTNERFTLKELYVNKRISNEMLDQIYYEDLLVQTSNMTDEEYASWKEEYLNLYKNLRVYDCRAYRLNDVEVTLEKKKYSFGDPKNIFDENINIQTSYSSKNIKLDFDKSIYLGNIDSYDIAFFPKGNGRALTPIIYGEKSNMELNNLYVCTSRWDDRINFYSIFTTNRFYFGENLMKELFDSTSQMLFIGKKEGKYYNAFDLYRNNLISQESLLSISMQLYSYYLDLYLVNHPGEEAFFNKKYLDNWNKVYKTPEPIIPAAS
jgi:hypothetical protein